MSPSRSRVAWFVAVLVALLSCIATHWLAHRLAPGHRHGDDVHEYLEHLPIAAAVAVAVVIAMLARHAALTASGEREPSASLGRVALIPPVAFAVQEHAERVIYLGTFPVEAALEPSFALGLVLQLPFAVLALALASWLLRSAEALGRLLRQPVSPVAVPTPRSVAAPSDATDPSTHHRVIYPRGPPLPVAALS